MIAIDQLIKQIKHMLSSDYDKPVISSNELSELLSYLNSLNSLKDKTLQETQINLFNEYLNDELDAMALLKLLKQTD